MTVVSRIRRAGRARPAAVALVIPLLAGPAEADDMAAAEVADRARDAQIVVLGEVHDNPEHHRVQAGVVAELQPAAVVFEMIPQELEDTVDALREDGASLAEIAAALDWEASGWPDFDFYAPILEAAPGARIFGGGQSAEDVAKAVEAGAAAAFGPDAEIYGLDQPLDPAELAAREAEQAEAHCDALPADRLAGFVEAQRFRDAALADAALWARTITGEGQVVVVAGTGHANKRQGIPSMIAIADPSVSVFALGQFEEEPGNAEDFDAHLVAPPPERDDPCAVFGEPG